MIRKKFKIYFAKEALEDLNKIIEFYKKLMFHLARNLVIELQETFLFFQNNPHLYDDYYDGEFGVLTLRKYPIEVYYHIDGQDIIVLAVKHKNETPFKWSERV